MFANSTRSENDVGSLRYIFLPGLSKWPKSDSDENEPTSQQASKAKNAKMPQAKKTIKLKQKPN